MYLHLDKVLRMHTERPTRTHSHLIALIHKTLTHTRYLANTQKAHTVENK